MQLKTSADKALAFFFIVLSAVTLALVRPITLDLTVYTSWLSDLDSYQFDQGFMLIGRIVRVVSDNVRVLIFLGSILLQLAVLRCCTTFYPDVSQLLFVVVGSTTYWHVSLSSNVVRNGFAVSVAALILTASFGSRRIRFALSFIAATITHWATFIYFFVLWVARPGQRIKIVHLIFLVVAASAVFALGFFYFDLAGKLILYTSTDVFTEDRSSQTPRMLAQVFLVVFALYFQIAPKSLDRALWLALGILLILSPFPEGFSRTSILIGILLHIIYFGRILSENRISYPLKVLGIMVIAMFQLLHPSTAKLLGLV